MPVTVPLALSRPGELRRPEQQRVHHGDIDVGRRHLQRVAPTAERAVRGDPLIAVHEPEVLDRDRVVPVLNGRLGPGGQSARSALRRERELLQVHFLMIRDA